MDIRRAVIASSPVPPEQFFTMMVPGKVLNFEDFTKEFDMPALSGVQLGPTDRSAANSYSTSLSKFCPAGSTVGMSRDIDEEELSEAKRRYKAALKWPLEMDADDATKSRIDVYRDKQEKCTQAFERKTNAFNDALKQAVEDPRNDTLGKQRAEYDRWVSENKKTHDNFVQAAYMDWVEAMQW